MIHKFKTISLRQNTQTWYLKVPHFKNSSTLAEYFDFDELH